MRCLVSFATLVLASLVLACRVPAQACYEVAGPKSTGTSQTPFGGTLAQVATLGNQRYQQLLLPTDIGGGSCPGNNTSATTTTGQTHGVDLYAYRIPPTAGQRTVLSIDLLTRSTITTANNLGISILLEESGLPGKSLDYGIMALTSKLGWHRAVLKAPVVIPANTAFYVYYTARDTMERPEATTGTTWPYFRRPLTGSTTWKGPFDDTKWAFRVNCAGVGWITSLAFKSATTGQRHFDTLRVQLSYLAGTAGTLSTDFDANLANPVTVLDVENHDWPVLYDTFRMIGLQRRFLYEPNKGPLVVDILVTGAHILGVSDGSSRTVDRERVFATGWKTTPPKLGTRQTSGALHMKLCYEEAAIDSYGRGCPGGSGKIPALTFQGVPSIGSAWQLVGSRLPSQAPYFLVLGASRMKTPLLLPGTASCLLYMPVDVLLTGKADDFGTFSSLFPVPDNPKLRGHSLYLQVFPWDAKANAFGASATQYLRLLMGR